MCILGTAASRRAVSLLNRPMKNRGNKNSSSYTTVVYTTQRMVVNKMPVRTRLYSFAP